MKNLIIVLFLLGTIKSFGTGWNDYEIKIDENYTIVKPDNINLGFYKKDNITFYKIITDKQTGSMYAYYVTKKYIFTKHYGLQMRNKFEGDSYQFIDRRKKIFYIIKKKDNSYLSFNDKVLFNKKIIKITKTPIKWLFPFNPTPKNERQKTPWFFYILSFFIFLYEYSLKILLVLVLIFSFRYYVNKMRKEL